MPRLPPAARPLGVSRHDPASPIQRPARSVPASSRGRGKRRRGGRGRGSPYSDEDDFDDFDDEEDEEDEEVDGQGAAGSGHSARNVADASSGLVDASSVLSPTLNSGPVVRPPPTCPRSCGPDSARRRGGRLNFSHTCTHRPASHQYRFALRRHPHETRLPQLKRPYIKTSGAFTVRHMKKLLLKRLQTDLDLEFYIFHRQPIVLPELLALESIIKRAFPDGDGELIIFYKVAS